MGNALLFPKGICRRMENIPHLMEEKYPKWNGSCMELILSGRHLWKFILTNMIPRGYVQMYGEGRREIHQLR